MSYVVHDRQAMRDWWAAVRTAAQSTIVTSKGSRVYVLESIDELARTPREYKFLKVHVVSVASGSQYETERFINTPAVLRLWPADDIASIGPVVDAEVVT